MTDQREQYERGLIALEEVTDTDLHLELRLQEIERQLSHLKQVASKLHFLAGRVDFIMDILYDADMVPSQW